MARPFESVPHLVVGSDALELPPTSGTEARARTRCWRLSPPRHERWQSDGRPNRAGCARARAIRVVRRPSKRFLRDAPERAGAYPKKVTGRRAWTGLEKAQEARISHGLGEPGDRAVVRSVRSVSRARCRCVGGLHESKPGAARADHLRGHL